MSMETQQSIMSHHMTMTSTSIANATNLSSLLDVKPKLEHSMHLQHLHQMSAMGMGMTQMGLHHSHPSLHSHLPPLPTSVANSQSSPSPTMLMN
jgi:hypothetical protein